MYIPLLQSLDRPNQTSSPTSPAASSSSTNSSGTDETGGLDTMFLKLLAAQLHRRVR